jgi:anti-anti-sigma factor
MGTQRGHPWLAREDIDGVTVVRLLQSRLQGETCKELFGLLSALVDEAGCRHLLLDLGGVVSVDSVAIGKLVLLNRQAEAAGGRLALCHLADDVRRPLETMHLTDVIAVYGDREEAVASFPAEPAPGEDVGG